MLHVLAQLGAVDLDAEQVVLVDVEAGNLLQRDGPFIDILARVQGSTGRELRTGIMALYVVDKIDDGRILMIRLCAGKGIRRLTDDLLQGLQGLLMPWLHLLDDSRVILYALDGNGLRRNLLNLPLAIDLVDRQIALADEFAVLADSTTGTPLITASAYTVPSGPFTPDLLSMTT